MHCQPDKVAHSFLATLMEFKPVVRPSLWKDMSALVDLTPRIGCVFVPVLLSAQSDRP